MARRAWALVLGLTLLAAAVRFSTLGVQSFGGDEGFTHALATGPWGGLWDGVRHTESAPPLSYALAWGWVRLFGDGEVGLRSLTALLGTALVPVTFLAAREVVSRRAAVVAAGLVALSPFLVWYSQEARAYALLALLGTASFGLAARARREPTWRALIGWGAVSALALATHYFAIFAIAAETVWLFGGLAGRRRQLGVAVGVPVAIGAALLPLLLYQNAHVPRPWTSVFGPRDQFAATVEEFAVGPTWTWLIHRPGVAVAFVCGAIAIWALVRRGRVRERRGALIAAAVALAILVVPLALSLVGPTYLAPRNVIVALPIGAIVLAAGLAAGRAGLVAGVALAALWLAIDVAVPLTPALQRAPWRQVAADLGTSPGPRLLLLPDGFLEPPVARAYLPAARVVQGAPPPVREVAIIASARYARLVLDTPPGPGFVLAERRDRRGELGMTRWVAPQPTRIGVPPGAVVLELPGGSRSRR